MGVPPPRPDLVVLVSPLPLPPCSASFCCCRCGGFPAADLLLASGLLLSRNPNNGLAPPRALARRAACAALPGSLQDRSDLPVAGNPSSALQSSPHQSPPSCLPPPASL